jgi:8-oxo-dGTP pyrophosphatase MutT (NUDIX family)
MSGGPACLRTWVHEHRLPAARGSSSAATQRSGSYRQGMTTRDESGAARWTVFGERTLYESPWVQLVKVDVQPPGGKRFEHHVVRLQRVAIALVVEAGQVLMVRHHRFVTDDSGWELPGGIVEHGEDPAAAASREVEEETGWRPGALEPLVGFQPMVGMVDTPHDIFVATSARQIGEPADLEAGGHAEWIPLDAVPDLIAKGEIIGSGSLVGLLYYLMRGGTKVEGE